MGGRENFSPGLLNPAKTLNEVELNLAGTKTQQTSRPFCKQ